MTKIISTSSRRSASSDARVRLSVLSALLVAAYAVACSPPADTTQGTGKGGSTSSDEVGGNDDDGTAAGGAANAGGSKTNKDSVGGSKPGESGGDGNSTGGRKAAGGSTNAANAGGAGAAGGSTSSGAGGGAAGNSSGEAAPTVGRFSVLLNGENQETATPAYTTVSGRVYDGTTPSAYLETTVSEQSGCSLVKLSVPTCDESCGTGLCVAENTCKDYPRAKNVGTVTVTGVAMTTGEKTVTLKSVSNSYQVGGGAKVAYPGFAEGDDITLEASGADYPAFTLKAKGVGPLTLSQETFRLSKTSALDLQWTAASSSADSHIEVELNLSHHGGSKGYITCDVPDSGSFSVPAELIGGLIDLGVAGYPTLTVSRISADSTTLEPGTVVLEVTSIFSRTISVENYESCVANGDCPTGKTCDTGVKLCK